MPRRRAEWAEEHRAIFEAGVRAEVGDAALAEELTRAGAATSASTVGRRRRAMGVTRRRGRRRAVRASLEAVYLEAVEALQVALARVHSFVRGR